MNAFPETLVPSNRENFRITKRNKIKCMLREEIYDTILDNNPESFYDISSFKYFTDTELHIIVKELLTELTELGWETEISYGDTGLFVYTGDRPNNCW